MSLSIRWRLVIWITASMAVTLIAVFFALTFALRATLTSDLDDDLSRGVSQISALMLIRGSLDSPEAVRDVVDRYSVGGLGSGFIVALRDPEGRVVASTAGVNPDEFALTEGEMERVLDGDELSRNVDISGGEEVRIRSAVIALGGDALAIVQVGESRDPIAHTLSRLRAILIAVGTGAMVVSMAMAYWLSRRALRPVENVATVAGRIEATDLSQRINARGEATEVQRLADTFDAMIGRLESAFDQQRDFVLDVAHELRTPLTALRGNIDVLLMGEGLDADTIEQLQRMSAEVGRLIRLASNLLYLALADAGHEPDRRPVELDTVCLEVYRLLRDLRPEVQLRLGKEDQVSVVGDRDLLKQLILNLVENGLKYTSAGGQVTLALFKDDDEVRIVVEDTGPGIPPEEQSRIFERLYRGPGRGKGGSGLGLAIAHWIASSHGGRISVESEVGVGSTFTVTLPLGPEAADTPGPREQERRPVVRRATSG